MSGGVPAGEKPSTLCLACCRTLKEHGAKRQCPETTYFIANRATPTPPIEGRDADVERVEKVAIAMYCADNGMDSDTNSAHIHYWFRDPDEKDKGAVDEYRVMARAALQALGERG